MTPIIKLSLLAAALAGTSGIVHAATITVTSTADSGPGTLRAAVATALAQGGSDEINFAAPLSGQTIVLTSGAINAGNQVLIISAAALPAGLTLDGNEASRLFSVPAGGSLELRGLTLTRGVEAGSGGAVSNAGTLTALGCTFSACRANSWTGGAVSNGGTFTASQCTFSGNQSFNGGALMNAGTATLTECTVSGNTAGNGAGIFNSAALTVSGSIIADNGLPFDLDIHNTGTITRVGSNLISSMRTGTGGTDSGPAAISAPARLRALGRYGGPVPTMPPAADSPALDRIPTSSFTTDQRGFPRIMWGAADIGAVEAGTQADCAWELREFYRSPATPLNSLTDALALVSDPAAVVLVSTPGEVNRNDPGHAASGDYFSGDESYASNNKTPAGLINGDDDDFAIVARTFINITAEDDYTFGFAGSEGAQLRIFGASFTSSTRLNPANPSNPAHAGDSLIYSGLTDNAATLGVCHLTPGVYPVEFVSWERNGGASSEVFAARGAKTAIDSSFRLVGSGAAGGPLTAGTLTPLAAPAQWTQEFEDGTGGFTVTNINGPFEGPWTRDEVNGTWASAGQSTSAAAAPSTLLTGPSVVMQCLGDAILHFNHRFSFEDGNWDGGQVRLSVNGGPFIPVPGSAFTQNGYNGSVAPTSISDIRGQQAFVTDSTGYATPVFITSAALLGSFNAGDTLRIQFLASYDRDNRRGNPAWEIDSVNIEQRCTGGTPGWEVTTIRNGADSLGAALNQVFGKWSGVTQANSLVTQAVTLNFEGPGSGGGHGGTVPFPGDTAGNDDQFALGGRAVLNVPVSGDYTFCLVADDSARLRIPGSRGWVVPAGNGVTLLDGFSGEGGGDVFGQVYLTAGPHPLEVVFHESAGNALVSLWAARGRHEVFHADVFSLVGGPGPVRPDAPFSLVRQAGLSRPANDEFSAAGRLDSVPARVVACTTGAGLEPGEPSPVLESAAVIGGTVWWKWQAPATGIWTVDTEGSDFDTVLAVYTGTGTSLSGLLAVASRDSYGSSPQARVTFTAEAGTTYLIQAGGAGAVTGHLVLQLQAAPSPSHDAFASALPLGLVWSVSAGTRNDAATAEAGEPPHFPGIPARASLWYSWTPPATGDYLVDTRGSRFDSVLSIYTGSTLANLVRVASNDDISGSVKQSALVFRAFAGILYRIALDDADAASRGEARLNISWMPAVSATEFVPGTNPALRLTVQTEPWTTSTVESAVGLTPWSVFATGLAAPGPVSVMDLGLTLPAQPRKFFRVRRE